MAESKSEAQALPKGVTAISVEGTKEVKGKAFPLSLGPDKAGVSLNEWVANNRKTVYTLCMEHGAILFRGFSVENPEAFAEVVDGLHLENMPYVGGAAVRTNVVGDKVFTSNESPPSEPIPFHHEMAQVPNPPKYLFFYCDVQPKAGGETPIIHSNHVYEYFAKTHPEFCKKVEDCGLKYVRVMPAQDDPSSAIGRSWRSTFQVDSKEAAEEKMKELGTTWEWLPNDDLKTVTATIPGIRTDPRTSLKTFFNSMIAAYLGWVDKRNDPKKAVRLGNDEPVDAAVLDDVAKFMEQVGHVDWVTVGSRG